MSTRHDQQHEPGDTSRLDALLADRAVFGLDHDEQAELDALLADAPEAPDRFDLLTANLWLATQPQEEALPDRLRARLLEAAPSGVTPASRSKSNRSPGWGSLFFAMAASLLLGLYLGSIETETPPATPDIVALLNDQPDATNTAWTATDDPAAVGLENEPRDSADWGEVVWSDSLQQGYMRFRGLAANDASLEQYQLWIFDSERSDAHPVDGGVFDLKAVAEDEAGEGQIVEIRAKLPVSKAVMFAITVEQPGGVVVSDRSRLPLLAKL